MGEAEDPPQPPPNPTADFCMLAPAQQRAILLVHRPAAVPHVVAPVSIGDSSMLVVRDGPTNVQVTNLPAAWPTGAGA